MADQNDKRLTWLASVFDSALKHGVFRPVDVIAHATPEVLAQHLPKELQVRLLEVALDSGKMTPEGILGVAPPATLARHVPPATLWQTVRDAAARHGIAAGSNGTPKSGKTPLRSFISDAIAAGLEREIFSAADVTRHVPPSEWVRDVPLDVVSKLIAAGLTRPAFDPRLALEHLTPQVIGEYVKPHLSWAILDEGAARAFGLGAATATVAAATAPAPAAAAPAPAAEPAAPSEFSAEAVDSWVDSGN